MLRAFGRLLKMLGYILTFRANKISSMWAENPEIVRAEYEEIITKKLAGVRSARSAVASMMVLLESKTQELNRVRESIGKNQRLMNGAVAMAKRIAAGRSEEEASKDPEYIKYRSAYHDFKTTLEQLTAREEGLKTDIETSTRNVEGYQVQLQHLHRDLQKLQEEKENAVVGMVMSAREREINEALAGIGQDNTAEQLANLRQRVGQVQAEAKVTAKLAGNETARQEAEFMNMAGTIEADTDFANAVHGKKEAEARTPAAKEAPLPTA